MRTMTVSGGNLYALALSYLGDATQWNRIAQANGLLDPVIVGVVTLNIPSEKPSATGGILAF